MICYSLRLLRILPENADHVVTALRREGLLAELKKEIPGHIGCSILESDLTSDLYLVIDFWRSKYDFFESEIAPTGTFLREVLDRLVYQQFTLGPFSFPPSSDAMPQMAVDRENIPKLAAASSEVEQVEVVRN